MHLILMRHAEKDFSDGNDPALSARGLQHTQWLGQTLLKGDWPRPEALLASPKRRTQQTLGPLALATGAKIVVESALDERGADESLKDFRGRLGTLLGAVPAAGAGCVVWCTHLDCLDELRSLIGCEIRLGEGLFLDWRPAQYAVLRFENEWQFLTSGKPS